MKVTVIDRGTVRNMNGLKLVLQAETQAESALLKMASVNDGKTSAVYGNDVTGNAKLDLVIEVD